MDALNEVFGTIRQLLSQPPSWENWNQLILFLDSWPENSTGLSKQALLEYVQLHIEKEWNERFRLGNQAWPHDSIGWKLTRNQKKIIRGIPDSETIWCPPGRWLRYLPDSFLYQEFELEYGFWIQEAPLTLQQFYHCLYFQTPHNFSLDLVFSDPFRTRHRWERHETITDFDWLSAVRLCNLLSRMNDLEPAYELRYVGEPYEEWMEDWDRNPYDLRLEDCLDGSATFAWDVHFKGLMCEGFRLPTVAEWEVALLATNDVYSYDSFEAARHPANAWGLQGVRENHLEWCWNVWTAWDEESCVSNPCSLPDPNQRTLRQPSRPEHQEVVNLHLTDHEQQPILRYDWPGAALRVCRTALDVK
jgi:hypothetical protein